MENAELFVYILIGAWAFAGVLKSWPLMFFISLGGLGYAVWNWAYIAGYNLSSPNTSGGKYSIRGGPFPPWAIALLCIVWMLIACFANKEKDK